MSILQSLIVILLTLIALPFALAWAALSLVLLGLFFLAMLAVALTGDVTAPWWPQ